MKKENEMNSDKVSINLLPKDADPETRFIKEALKGSKDAFRKIFEDNVSKVYSVCLRFTSDSDLAKELTQQVFINAWQKLSSFKFECRLSTWLHKIAFNQFLMNDRSEKRILKKDKQYSEETAGLQSSDVNDIRIDLQNAIFKLPEQCRAVLILHDVEGFMHHEIAEILKIKTGTSKAHLHRARKLLREELNK
ncbi:MAG: sigma-70 family RNA polymerase sigma factor [Bacteroidetes bacterium]|nr:sigma-70 family RNA polymerase sigma factor [Bacteroidota bacterium]